jgi:hypothetical protein
MQKIQVQQMRLQLFAMQALTVSGYRKTQDTAANVTAGPGSAAHPTAAADEMAIPMLQHNPSVSPSNPRTRGNTPAGAGNQVKQEYQEGGDEVRKPAATRIVLKPVAPRIVLRQQA